MEDNLNLLEMEYDPNCKNNKQPETFWNKKNGRGTAPGNLLCIILPNKILLAPMLVLAPESAHTRPSVWPLIDTKRHFQHSFLGGQQKHFSFLQIKHFKISKPEDDPFSEFQKENKMSRIRIRIPYF